MEEDTETELSVVFYCFTKALDDADEGTLDFHAEASDRFYDTAAVAVGAGGVHTASSAFLRSLAGHLHDAESGNGEDVVTSFIFGHFVLHNL